MPLGSLGTGHSVLAPRPTDTTHSVPVPYRGTEYLVGVSSAARASLGIKQKSYRVRTGARQKPLKLKPSMLTMRCLDCRRPCLSTSGRCWDCDAAKFERSRQMLFATT
jgi:hypothetical protein